MFTEFSKSPFRTTGSEQEFVERYILGGFLESDESGQERGQRLHVNENGQNSGVRRGNDVPRAVWRSLNSKIVSCPRRLETRTERGLPAPHRRRRRSFYRKSQTRLNRGLLQILAQNRTTFEGCDVRVLDSRELGLWYMRFSKMANDETLRPDQNSNARILVQFTLWAHQELAKFNEMRHLKKSLEDVASAIEMIQYDGLIDPITGQIHDLRTYPEKEVFLFAIADLREKKADYLKQIDPLQFEYNRICNSLPADMKYRVRKALQAFNLSRDSILWRRLEDAGTEIDFGHHEPENYTKTVSDLTEIQAMQEFLNCLAKRFEVLEKEKEEQRARAVDFKSPFCNAIHLALLSLGDKRKKASTIEIARWISSRMPQLKLPNSYGRGDLVWLVRQNQDVRQRFQASVSKVRKKLGIA